MAKKLADRIAAERRKREKRRRPEPVNLEPATLAETKRYLERHTDLLQNIETMLFEQSLDDESIDDRSIYTAIRCYLLHSDPPNESTARVLFALNQLRELRQDASDDVWNDGLRVLLGSLHTHSSLRPGEMGYLDFVGEFMP